MLDKVKLCELARYDYRSLSTTSRPSKLSRYFIKRGRHFKDCAGWTPATVQGFFLRVLEVHQLGVVGYGKNV
jgi:hypothetical protein